MDDRRQRRPEDDWIFDPALAAINRSLHRELRAEAELRARTLADIAREARNRGDRVSIATTQRGFNGQVIYAAGDLVTLRSRSFEVDINLDDVAYVRVIERGRSGGRALADGPGTFEMRLVERRSPHVRVEVGYRALRETLMGRVTTVGQDHILVLDDQDHEWVLPLGAVSYVVRRVAPDRRTGPVR